MSEMLEVRWPPVANETVPNLEPVWLRAVTGHDEELLFGKAAKMPAAARVTALLTRCTSRAGGEALGEDAVRRLTVGRREHLLLALRRLTLGDRISCIFVCPECEQSMDGELSVGELLREVGAEDRTYEVSVDVGGERWRALFRLPSGADQEAAASLAQTDSDAAGQAILESCLRDVSRQSGKPASTETPAELMVAVEAAMADADPQAETRLRAKCPECGASFSTVFDAADYFFKELAASNRDLYRDVHSVALSYHWSEDAILSMSFGRRQMYLKLLAESIPSAES
jgi:hypothetical protein